MEQKHTRLLFSIIWFCWILNKSMMRKFPLEVQPEFKRPYMTPIQLPDTSMQVQFGPCICGISNINKIFIYRIFVILYIDKVLACVFRCFLPLWLYKIYRGDHLHWFFYHLNRHLRYKIRWNFCDMSTLSRRTHVCSPIGQTYWAPSGGHLLGIWPCQVLTTLKIVVIFKR